MHRRHTPKCEPSPVTPIFGLASPAADPPASPLRDALESTDWIANSVRDLCDLVGGIDALERLDSSPLPPRPFALDALVEEDRRLVEEVIHTIANRRRLLPQVFADPIDDELWVVITSLLELIVHNKPAVLRRGSVVRTAAAITWLALRGNDMLGRGGIMTAESLWYQFDVGDCAERGRSLHAATGLTRRPNSWSSSYQRVPGVWLCDVSLLHSRARHRLVQRREDLEAAVTEYQRIRLARRPIVDRGDGTAQVRARPVTPRWVRRASLESGRAVVLVTFGETQDDPEVVAMSVPDARHLVSMLHDALAAPVFVAQRTTQ